MWGEVGRRNDSGISAGGRKRGSQDSFALKRYREDSQKLRKEARFIHCTTYGTCVKLQYVIAAHLGIYRLEWFGTKGARTTVYSYA